MLYCQQYLPVSINKSYKLHNRLIGKRFFFLKRRHFLCILLLKLLNIHENMS